MKFVYPSPLYYLKVSTIHNLRQTGKTIKQSKSWFLVRVINRQFSAKNVLRMSRESTNTKHKQQMASLPQSNLGYIDGGQMLSPLRMHQPSPLLRLSLNLIQYGIRFHFTKLVHLKYLPPCPRLTKMDNEKKSFLADCWDFLGIHLFIEIHNSHLSLGSNSIV